MGNHSAQNNLNGPLPWELTKLEHLTDISLFSNALSGTIPSGFGYLHHIELQNNTLQGTIPVDILVRSNSDNTSVEGLSRLLLSHNQLTGTIPAEIGLSTWSRIYLDNNQLSGSLPMEVWGAGGLKALYIRDNPKVGNPILLGNQILYETK